MLEGLVLKQELKKLGITSKKLALQTGLHWTTISRKMNTNNFSETDKIVFGKVLEDSGGDPSIVWPEWNIISKKDQVKVIEPEAVELTQGVKLVEGSILSKPTGLIHIPNFGNLDLWIRILSSDIECDQFMSGQIFALEKITDMDGLIFGGTYYVYSFDFEGLRIIQSTNDQKIINLIPFNKKLSPHTYSLVKKLDIYRVKGMISWL